MNVLSLFDGISCAMVALDRAGIPVDKYYSCEIEKNAIKVSKKNYPDIISLGSVIDFQKDMIKEPIDLLVGGSPCQDLSIAKKNGKGLEGEKSSLFYEYVRIKNEMKPKYFILENVASMKKKDKDIITGIMGCEPVMFNASLVSAQTRKRYFWTNIKFDLPLDRGILLKDIIQLDAEVDERMINKEGKFIIKVNKNFMAKDGKALCVTLGYNQVSVSQNEINRCINGVYKNNYVLKDGVIIEDDKDITPIHIRKLTPIECERLQSLPDNYTEGIAMTNRYKCLGNAFNVEVVAHILKHI
jgi:site-specific DNA-cytosine methylase